MKATFPVSATIAARAWLVDSKAGWKRAAFPIRYGVIERPDGLMLVDTGYSTALFDAAGAALTVYRWLLKPTLDPEGDALAVVQNLGAEAGDVRAIVVTHLHADHICGIDRFPKAVLHLSAKSLALWRAAPSRHDYSTGLFRALLPPLASVKAKAIDEAAMVALPWGGMGFDVLGDASVLAVDLPGHMEGHVGLFFPEQTLFYAVDADWTTGPILSGRPPNWPARMIVHDIDAAMRSGAIVRKAADWGARILLAHDPKPWP